MIKLKEILMNEMPMDNTILDMEIVNALEKKLKVKISGDYTDVDKIPISGGYVILKGFLNDIKDCWAAIVNPDGIDNKVELCFGASLKLSNFTRDLPSYQVMLSCKYKSYPKYTASTLYITLVKKYNIALFSDERVTNEGKGIWYELLTRPHLENEGVRLFVFDKKTRKEITNYGNIDDLFGIDNKFENILVGIKPI
jgi:hypothetical protein